MKASDSIGDAHQRQLQVTFMDEAERQSKRCSPGPATYYPKVRLNIMQQENRKEAHQRVLNVLKVIKQVNKLGGECCLLVLNAVPSTPQWIRQPKAAWGLMLGPAPQNLRLVLHLSRRLRTLQPTHLRVRAIHRRGN